MLFKKMILKQTGFFTIFLNTDNNFDFYFFTSQKHFVLTHFGLNSTKLGWFPDLGCFGVFFSCFYPHTSLLLTLLFFLLKQIQKKLSKSGKRKSGHLFSFWFLHLTGLKEAQIFISVKHLAPISALIVTKVKEQRDDKSIYHFNVLLEMENAIFNIFHFWN